MGVLIGFGLIFYGVSTSIKSLDRHNGWGFLLGILIAGIGSGILGV